MLIDLLIDNLVPAALTALATFFGGLWVVARKYLKKIRSIVERWDMVAGQIESLDRKFDIFMEADQSLAAFECDAHMSNIAVSTSYCQQLGRSESELLGKGYMNAIPERERESIFKEIEACKRDHRAFDHHHHLTRADGSEIYVHTRCWPIPGTPPAKSWMGFWREVPCID